MILTAGIALIVGLFFLIWSADYFLDGAIGTAETLHIPPLMIGMLVVGFGTSAPEMIVSAFSAFQGNPGLALGNAYGSNIANIALILGITAMIGPIIIPEKAAKRELPLLLLATFCSLWQLRDGVISRHDGFVLLLLFILIMGWSLVRGVDEEKLKKATDKELLPTAPPLSKALWKLIFGLVVLMGSSKALVWGAVLVAQLLGVSDLVIGLTVVALGTSLPELASSIAAIRKNRSDIALGNVLGSNLFNTLMVVGIAATIHPVHTTAKAVLCRDGFIMAGLTVLLFLFGIKGKKTKIGSIKGCLLLLSYLCYIGWIGGSSIGLLP